MSLDGSDFLNEAEIKTYEERITLNQKMRTRLTLEQKQWIWDVIERLNHNLKTKAQNFYRYDVFRIRYGNEKNLYRSKDRITVISCSPII